MSEYDLLLAVALQFSVVERLRLIDDLASTIPDDQPPALSEEWLNEIARRSAEIDSGAVTTEPWPEVQQRLFGKHGISQAD